MTAQNRLYLDHAATTPLLPDALVAHEPPEARGLTRDGRLFVGTFTGQLVAFASPKWKNAWRELTLE